jgi:PST family polysaccharide transporter
LFSRVSEDPVRLRRGYLTTLRLQAAFGVAAGAGLCVIAPVLVPVVFGSKWVASAGALGALALYASARSLGAGAMDVYKGIGRPGLAASVSVIRFAVLVPALLIAVDGGIEAMAWTQAGLALVFAVGMQAVASRIVGLTAADLWPALRPALALGAGAVIGAGAVVWGVAGDDAARLVAAIACGTTAGAAAVWLLDAQFVRDTRDLLRGGGAPAAVATS